MAIRYRAKDSRPGNVLRKFCLSVPFGASAALLVLLASSRAQAQERTKVKQLAYDVRVDTAVTLTGLVWYVSSDLLKGSLVPEKCRWCYRRKDGTDALNTVDRSVRHHLMWKHPHTAHVLSNILAFGALPAMSFGLTQIAALHDDAAREIPVDALLIAEATVLALDFNQIAKYAFARERPFVHFLPRAPEGVRQLTASPSDDNLSFFSGHTTGAFAVASSAGMVASLRGYRLAPVVWSTGLISAAAVAYLRIAADKHYFSDVMLGAVVGTVLGAGLPLLFHRPETGPGPTSSARAPLTPGSISFSGTW